MGRTGRETEIPGEDVPRDRPQKSRQHNLRGDQTYIDKSCAHCCRDSCSEKVSGEKVEHRGPEYGHAGAQYASRDYRRDRIGCIMESVHVIEDERDTDDEGDEMERRSGHQLFLTATFWITSASSSQRSVVASRSS